MWRRNSLIVVICAGAIWQEGEDHGGMVYIFQLKKSWVQNQCH